MSLKINQIKPSMAKYQLICDDFSKKKNFHFSVIVNFYELNCVKAPPLQVYDHLFTISVHSVKSGIVHDILEMLMRQKVFQQNIDTWHVVIWPRIHCQSLEIPCSVTKSILFGFPSSKKEGGLILNKIGTKKSRAQTDLMTKVINARMDILTPFDKRAQNLKIDPGIINVFTKNSTFLPKITFV